jgi:hypothetical protein
LAFFDFLSQEQELILGGGLAAERDLGPWLTSPRVDASEAGAVDDVSEERQLTHSDLCPFLESDVAVAAIIAAVAWLIALVALPGDRS